MNALKSVQARVVSGLETLDGLLDAIPDVEIEVTQRSNGYFNFVTRICRRGGWGCILGVANLSMKLDDRWDTGVWKPVKPFQIRYLTPTLSREEQERVRQEFLPEGHLSYTEDPPRYEITWIERAVDAQSALREAREALAATGLGHKVGAFTFPKEITE